MPDMVNTILWPAIFILPYIANCQIDYSHIRVRVIGSVGSQNKYYITNSIIMTLGTWKETDYNYLEIGLVRIHSKT